MKKSKNRPRVLLDTFNHFCELCPRIYARLYSTTPVQVSDAGPWKYIDAGESVACGIRSDDTLWCWGDGADGKLGTGSLADATTPSQVAPGTNWKVVRIGRRHTCGIKTDDTAWCWGGGQWNQLGVNSWASLVALTPLEVYGGRSWKQLDISVSYSCGIDADNQLLCWGLLDDHDLIPQKIFY